jgi:hypothetical protein
MQNRLPTGLVLACFAAGIVALTPAHAFHEPGEGFCEGCHDAQGEDSDGANLRGSDPSSTCLRCHAKPDWNLNVLSDDGSSFAAGGDFYWLRKSFGSPRGGHQILSAGNTHGHNIVALDYGLVSDARHSSAPGGDFRSENLGCTSCHDPHALRGISGYRLLRGAGDPIRGAEEDSFTTPWPVAVAPRDGPESDTNHVAYGSGMSRWCGNCHGAFLEGTPGESHPHPAGESALLRGLATNYSHYLRTGDLSGSAATAYLALVPFETGATRSSALDPQSTHGPEASAANVMCLTCHRAHASAFAGAGRWDFSATFLADSHPGDGDTGITGQDVENSYYGRDMEAEFGTYQRSLCNKCHVWD